MADRDVAGQRVHRFGPRAGQLTVHAGLPDPEVTARLRREIERTERQGPLRQL
jgi:hypothetical protein